MFDVITLGIGAPEWNLCSGMPACRAKIRSRNMSQVPLSYSSSRAPFVGLAGSISWLLISIMCVACAIALLKLPLTLMETLPASQSVKAVRESAASPLQGLIVETATNSLLSEEDLALVQKINSHSRLEFKTLVIAETVVHVDEWEKLQEFVKSQLAAKNDIVSSKQASALLDMVRLRPRESTLAVESVGEGGSLSNSVALALLKQHEDNIHYMLVAVKAEPHLGVFKHLGSGERNLWNTVLSRVLTAKVTKEVRSYFLRTVPILASSTEAPSKSLSDGEQEIAVEG